MHVGGKGGNRPNSREKGLYLKFTCLASKGEFFISSLAFQGGQTRCLQRRGTRGAGLGNGRARARVDSAFLPGLPEGGDAFSLIRFVSGRKRAATVGNGVSVPWNRGWVSELPWTRTGVWWGKQVLGPPAKLGVQPA